MKTKSNWLLKQMKQTTEDVSTWPQWMIREVGIERSLETCQKFFGYDIFNTKHQGG